VERNSEPGLTVWAGSMGLAFPLCDVPIMHLCFLFVQ
jgi:hypothetical protein